MSPLPSDWNDDQKLWKTLENVPKGTPSSDFNYRVQNKIHQLRTKTFKSESENTETDWMSFFSGWKFAFASSIACIAVFYAWFLTERQSNNQPGLTSSTTPVMVSELNTDELTEIASHYELLQDLEVIEQLDELL